MSTLSSGFQKDKETAYLCTYIDHAPGSLKMMNRNKKRAFYQSERNKQLNGIKQKIFYPMQK